MLDYLLLMHRLSDEFAEDVLDWASYLTALEAAGRLRGGSAIGGGICVQKTGTPPGISGHLSGYIRVAATDFDDAMTLLAGNPVFDRGGTVEIRELPRGG